MNVARQLKGSGGKVLDGARHLSFSAKIHRKITEISGYFPRIFLTIKEMLRRNFQILRNFLEFSEKILTWMRVGGNCCMIESLLCKEAPSFLLVKVYHNTGLIDVTSLRACTRQKRHSDTLRLGYLADTTSVIAGASAMEHDFYVPGFKGSSSMSGVTEYVEL